MLMGCRIDVDGKGAEHTFFPARDAASQVKLVWSRPSPAQKASVGAGWNSGVGSALEREAHVRALCIHPGFAVGDKKPLGFFSSLSILFCLSCLPRLYTWCNLCCWFEISWETFNTNEKRCYHYFASAFISLFILQDISWQSSQDLGCPCRH